MGILGSIAGVFGGNAGADEIARAAADTKRFYKANQADERTQIDPYLGAGRQGVDYLTSFIKGGPDYIGEGGNAILDQVKRDVTGHYAAMGLNDSGASRDAITQALTKAILGIRGQMFGEGATVAGVGQNAIGQLIRSNRIASGGVAGANDTIGSAKAAGKMNMWNQIGGIADFGLDKIGGWLTPKPNPAAPTGGFGAYIPKGSAYSAAGTGWG